MVGDAVSAPLPVKADMINIVAITVGAMSDECGVSLLGSDAHFVEQGCGNGVVWCRRTIRVDAHH